MEVKPATDEEISARHTRGKSENEYWTFQQQLVERIKQEASINAWLVEALEQFVNELDHCDCPVPQPEICRFCFGRAALAAAKGKSQ